MNRLIERIRSVLSNEEREVFDRVLNEMGITWLREVLEDLRAYQSATTFVEQLSGPGVHLVAMEALRRALPTVRSELTGVAIERVLTASRQLMTRRTSAGPSVAIVTRRQLDRESSRFERAYRTVKPIIKRNLLSTVAVAAREDAISSLAAMSASVRGYSMWPYGPKPDLFDNMEVRYLAQVVAARMTRAVLGFTVAAAASHALDSMTRSPRLSTVLVSQEAQRWANERGASLVQRITDQQRQSIQQTIANQFAQPFPGQVQAAEQIRQSIGLRPDQVNAMHRYHLGLRAQGASWPRVMMLTKRYHDRLLNQRADLIARTESIAALNQGKLAMWAFAARAGLMPEGATKRWVIAKDERVCPICRPLDGRAVKIFEHFVISGAELLAPPAHPRCRCTLVLDVAQERRAAA